MSEQNATVKKARRTRSPGYPALGLEEAIAKASALYDEEKRNSAAFATVVVHWGYKPTSSSALQAVATLKKFGLLMGSGSGNLKKLALTTLALRIVQDKRNPSPERDGAIKKAALNPKLYQDLWKAWGCEMPSSANMEYHLVHDLKFNDDVVKGVIVDYRKTVSFAKLTDRDIIADEDQDDSDDREDAPPLAVESAPVSQVKGRPVKAQGMKQDVFTLDEGEAVLQWPAELTQASFEDLSDWLKLALRKIGRSISDKAPAPRMTITAHEAVEALSRIGSDEARAALEPCSDLEAD